MRESLLGAGGALDVCGARPLGAGAPLQGPNPAFSTPSYPRFAHTSMGGVVWRQFRSALREGVPESLRGIFEWEMPLDSEEEPQPRL